MTQTVEQIGKQGEIEITCILNEQGWQINRLDRLGLAKNGSWYFIEIKNKEPWEPPPAYQQGLPTYQYSFYKQMHYLFKIKTILIVKGKNGEWLAEFIDNLKPNRYYTLKADGKQLVFFNLKQFQPLFQFLNGGNF